MVVNDGREICRKKLYLTNFIAQSRNLPGSSEHFAYLMVFEPGQSRYSSETYVRRVGAKQVTLGTLFYYGHSDFITGTVILLRAQWFYCGHSDFITGTVILLRTQWFYYGRSDFITDTVILLRVQWFYCGHSDFNSGTVILANPDSKDLCLWYWKMLRNFQSIGYSTSALTCVDPVVNPTLERKNRWASCLFVHVFVVCVFVCSLIVFILTGKISQRVWYRYCI